MSRFGQWLRNDLSKINKPGEISRTVRRYPTIFVMSALNFVVAMLVIYAALALFGQAGAFGDWWFLAAVWASSSGGRMISERKSRVARPAEEKAPGE